MTIVFINGAFGIGKTSTARALKTVLGRGATYNPEIIGGVILRLPHWLNLTNQNSGDYQDIPLWRNMTALGIRLTRLVSPLVVVPMAFSNCIYLAQIMDKVRRVDADVRQVCLVAPLDVVESRLRKRGDVPKQLSWQLARARTCCAAHESEAFAPRIDATTRGPGEIAQEIAGLLA